MDIIKTSASGSSILATVGDQDFKAAGIAVANDYYGKRVPKTDTWEIKMETARDAFKDGDTWCGRGNVYYHVA